LQKGTLVFDEELPTFVAHGQSAVLYKGEHCVGGGVVEKVVY
jgi:tRNA U34 2-thiouridine synthase MnmA/TrmU